MPTLRSLRQRLSANGYILNSYIQMPSPFGAEIYARQGWDTVTLDIQHGLIGYEDAVAIMQAISAVDVLPLMRVSWLDPGEIMKLLDAGALGITCPMINTAADAERLVRYCKYPPRGERSMGPIRAAQIYGTDYPAKANDLVTVFAMIETAEGIANLAEITAVDGLDGIYVGPADLAMSLGRPVQREELDPEVQSAIGKILDQCRQRGLITGMIARNSEHALRLIEQGFQFITLSSDARALTGQAKSWVDGVRERTGV